MVALRTGSLEKDVSKGRSVICAYISDVERRYKYSGNFVKGLMGGRGNKDIVLGQDLNLFTCGSVCIDVDWQQVGGFSLKI